ncbi:MAG: hypothetical protein ACXVDB_00490 [Tumebacillaceae bacterium]
MPISFFNWLMFGLFCFMALMVVVRFAFYRRKDHPMGAVYFWGGLLLFTLTLADLISNVLYGTDVHHLQNVLTSGLGIWTLYQAVKKRRMISVNV